MKIIVRHLVTLCLLACVYPALSAQKKRTAIGSTQQYVDVGGHKLWLKLAGSGTPTVVLDYGLGGSIENWDDVFPEVTRFTRVVAYDRAGYGKSEPDMEPRSFERIAIDLHSMLHAAHVGPPYVLVGHSLGGANIRAFAKLFKDEVAGLVFIDPLNEKIFTSASEKEREAAIAQQGAALKGAPPGIQAEWQFLKGENENNFAQLLSFGAPPDVPMMLLVAGRDRPPGWIKSVLATYETWITEASEGGLVLTPDSSHAIQRDDPSLVISAIRRVVFPSVQNALERAIKQEGVDGAIAAYRRMKARYPPEFFRENVLNTLGYGQLGAKHFPEAIALFKLNVEMYPKGFNTYDSLAEGYMVQGNRALAIKNYRKSLALNPRNTGARDMLKKLQAP
ncbi:MAG: alpha/beta fold hydrolase [Acidobacteriota bacterium]|nr:alpha/beta fold hydrolase [Acidobacteriota bacterium]